MDDLETALARVRDRIVRHRGRGIGEQDTKAALIGPVLRALGWDTEDLEDVKLEHRLKSNHNPVDYALFLRREARLFIEAKPLGARLDDVRWAGQMLGYAAMAGVEWVALTDGDEWRIYNSHAAVPVDRKLFRTVRVSDPATSPAGTLALLAKERLAGRIIDEVWKAEFIDRQVRDAVRSLFGRQPDTALVRRLRALAPALSAADVRASLGRLTVTIEVPDVALTSGQQRPTRAPAPHRSTSRRVMPSGDRKTGVGTPWRNVSLAHLVGAGLVPLPLDIEHLYRGVALTAHIEAADRVVFEGRLYDSLSTAGGMARRSVVGAPTGRPYPQTNGWTFWQYRRADGTLGILDELRRELHGRKVVDLDKARQAGA